MNATHKILQGVMDSTVQEIAGTGQEVCVYLFPQCTSLQATARVKLLQM